MSVDLAGPPPVFGHPGPNQQEPSTEELMNMLVARCTRDGVFDPEEMRIVGAGFAALQAFAQQQQAKAQGAQVGPPIAEAGGTEPLSGGPGTEPYDDGSAPGVEPVGMGY